MHRSLQIGLLLAVSLHAFDEMALVIVLPTISAELDGSALYGVTLAAYVLAALVSTAWCGDWLDRHGPYGAFNLALLCFAGGLILATQAQTIEIFIFARILQGIGGGIVFTLAYSVTNQLCAADEKSRMVAWLDSAWLLPSLLAPAFAGLLVEVWSWRGLFWLQLPLLLVMAVLLKKPMRQLRRPLTAYKFASLIGALRIGLCCLAVVVLTAQPLHSGWLLLLPLGWMMWRPLSHVLPPQWWQLRTPLALTVVLHGGVFFVFYGVELYLPLYLIEARGMGITATGLALTCAAFAWVGASFLQSIADRNISHRQSLLVGILLFALALLMLALLLLPTMPLWIIYPAWGLMGFGMGFAYNSVATAAMLATERGREGATASATGVMDSLGIGLAAGLGGALKNQVEYRGGGLDLFMQLIGLLMLAVSFWLAWTTWRRFPKDKSWHLGP